MIIKCWGMAQVLEHLPSKTKALSSNPSSTQKKEQKKEKRISISI
jgi:hypothetical protein